MKKIAMLLMTTILMLNVMCVTAFASGGEDIDLNISDVKIGNDEKGNILISYDDYNWVLNLERENQLTGVVDTGGYRLNVRSGGGLEYNVISQLCDDDKVIILDKIGDWYKVNIPAREGYVYGEYLDIVQEAVKDSTEEKQILAEILSQISQNKKPDSDMTYKKENSLTPEGNLSLVDDIGTEIKAGQQFLSFVTKAGNTFYMVIDRNNKGEENVYFMNLVDEADLLSLMEEDERKKYEEEKPVVIEPPKEPEQPPTEPEPTKPEKKKSFAFPMLIIFLLGIGGVGGFLYIKLKGNKTKNTNEKIDPDADYQDDDEELDIPDEEDDDYDEVYEDDEYQNDDTELI